MQATFYNFAKRSNSTKFPPADLQSTVIDVTLKNGADILHPVFLLSLSYKPAFNYVFWDARDYFVSDIRSVRNNLWEVECEVDALASFRLQIFNTTAFVLYDGSANTEVIDTRLPVKTSATYSKNYATLSQSLMTGQWKIAVSVVGSDSTTTFLLTPAQVRQLVNSTDLDNWFNNIWQQVDTLDQTTDQSQIDVTTAITSAGSQIQGATDTVSMLKGLALASNSLSMAVNWCVGDGIRTFIKGMAKTFRKLIATPNAMECIKSAVFLPWDVVGDGSMQNIVLGEYDTGIAALPVYNPIQHGQTAIAIPWQAADWRRNAPYHQIYLYLPFMGDIEISPSDIIDCAALNIYYSLNVMTGALNYRVATDQDTTIGVFSCQTGVSYPIGASNITPVSVGMALGSAAAAIAGAPTLAAAATAAASLSSIRPSTSCVGGGGGGAGSGLDMRVIIHSVFHDTVVQPASVQLTAGTPTGSVKTLSALAGLYVQTQNASVGIDDNTAGSKIMTDWERQEINRLLDGGVYLE